MIWGCFRSFALLRIRVLPDLMMDTHRCIAIGRNCLSFRITRVHFRLFGSLCCSCAVHPSTGTRITISHKYVLSGNFIFSTRLALPERGYKKKYIKNILPLTLIFKLLFFWLKSAKPVTCHTSYTCHKNFYFQNFIRWSSQSSVVTINRS
jgi:hypothetical protein